MRIYTEKRAAFLKEHPWCQVWLKENGINEADVVRTETSPGKVQFGERTWVEVPLATDIHHVEGRGKNYLREETWMAVSRPMHRKIHDNKSWARAKGYLK